MACGQVFGVQRGYLCERDGVVVETMVDHHHVDADHQVGHHEDDWVPHEHDEDEEGTEYHEPLKVDMEAPPSWASVSAPVVHYWVEDVLAAFVGTSLAASRQILGETEFFAPQEWPPTMAVTVARNVVRLV